MSFHTKNLKVKLKYWFDTTLSSGTLSLIIWLGIACFIIVLASAGLVSILNIDPQEKEIAFLEALWISLMRTLDPGNLSNDTGWSFRLIMLLVTIVGLFMVSTLIGIINSGIGNTLEILRKGKSFVNEKNHILILGWSPMIFSLVKRLVTSNYKSEKMCIVILADKDKIDMEDEIRAKVEYHKNIKIICRSGNALDINDIEIVNPHEAKTIVLISPEDDVHDIYGIKAIMALMKSHRRKTEKYNIISEFKDQDSLEIIGMMSKDEVTPISSEDLFTKITVQASLQSGLSEVYHELLDHKTVGIEFMPLSYLLHKTYKEALQITREGVLIGMRKADGKIHVNPDHQMLFEPGDQAIVINRHVPHKSGNNHKINIQEDKIVNKVSNCSKPQKTLILGWNKRGCYIVRELEKYYDSGSEITIVADTPDFLSSVENLKKEFTDKKLTAIQGNIRSKEVIYGANPQNYDHIIVLCYTEQMDLQSADALTLIILLYLRKIAEQYDCKYSIASEILDIRNRNLAEVTHADDYIISDRIISMVLSQLAKNIDLKYIFDELLTHGESEIFLLPACDYIQLNTNVNFNTVIASASLRNETAIGYKKAADVWLPEKNFGICLAPDKNEDIVFAPEDKIIIILEVEL
jgi:voltage-gated potassium channel Kch